MTFSPVGAILAAALLVTAVAASPQPAQPSNPAELTRMLGKSAAAMTFVPLEGAARPLVTLGRPTVVIAFASWCHACIDEMPRTLSEYAKYRDRVTFLGIDYSDPPAVARQLAARFAIPFPVESYVPGNAKPPATVNAPRKIILPVGITQQQILSLKAQLPPADYQRIETVYRARSTMTPEHFGAYERWMSVFFEDPKQMAAKPAAPSAVMGLPHTFVIDARGNVAQILEGYDPSTDRVAKALAGLGIR